MDRLVKPDVKELSLTFTPNQTCTATFRLTNLMHTMSVAVSLSTTNPSYLSFPHPFSILPPLSTSSFSLHLSPSSHPPLSSPPDTVLVRSSMLPTGKADPDNLLRLFSKPSTPLVFKDATIPISLVGPHVIESLLSPPINRTLEVGEGRLTWSPELSKNGTLEVAFLMLKAISGCDQSDLTSLLRAAAETGHPHFVSALIDAGADVNNRDSEGKSVVSLAVRKGDVDSVRILTASGFKIDNSMDNLLHDAAAVDRVDIMEVLCLGFQDIDVNSVDSNGRTALHVAAVRGQVNSIQFLLSVGGDPDIVDSNGWAPLHFAMAKGHVEAAEWLLDATTFAKSAITKEGLTAYALAVEKGHSELYDSLQLSDVLHRSARINDVRGMKSCIAQGGNVNGRDQNGWTPLHRAAFKGGTEGVKVLLSHGARVDVVDDCGYTPLQRAVEAGHVKVAVCLIEHGARGKAKGGGVGNKKGLGFEMVPLNSKCFKRHPSLVTTTLCQENERA
ncbi:protein VAPYRIN-LIKE-like [Rhododendron vialii]|uniref:protein VAPYRIN-LIKE-like n=1 Tax=Rhododendron vialii TaxID=182163 RepID=UPI00265E77AC|nr:protein VAPYRIN-LIKE-like [Rhododendron vialii]